MGQHHIDDQRKEYLIDNFINIDFYDEDEEVDMAKLSSLFNEIKDPAEIYFLAENFNWDNGPTIAEWIVSSPLCTKAAALVIFWTSAPDEYMEYEFGSSIPKYNSDQTDQEQTSILNLLEKLVTRFSNNDFNKLEICFDFSHWGCKLMVNSPKWSVCEEFYKSIDGVEVV